MYSMPSSPEDYSSSLYWCVCQLMSWDIDTLQPHWSAWCLLHSSILWEYIVWIKYRASSSSIPKRKFTEVTCIQYVGNLAYKSVAEVGLGSCLLWMHKLHEYQKCKCFQQRTHTEIHPPAHTNLQCVGSLYPVCLPCSKHQPVATWFEMYLSITR